MTGRYYSFIIRSVYVVSQSSLMRSAPFSPIIIVGAFVLPLEMVGTESKNNKLISGQIM